MDIGKKIASLRKTKNITQAQLAEYLSVTPQTVSRWESNNGVPDIYLLPNISAFFDVSIEELYGINNTEKIRNLVYKYSILRDEKSYKDAMTLIDNALEGACDENESQFILAQKMHMFLQKSREYLNRADSIADTLLTETESPENPLHWQVKMQKTQFNVLQGKGQETLLNLKNNYETCPSAENTELYMCVLLEMFRYKELLEMYDDENVQELLSKDVKAALVIYDLLFTAAMNENDAAFFEKHLDDFEKIADPESLLSAHFYYAKVLKNKGDVNLLKKYKEKMLGELSAQQANETMFNYLSETIRSL